MSGAARGNLFVISAPSGAGKSTLVARLMKAVDGVTFSVSWTTRAPRAGEVDGTHYHFTDDARFRKMIADGDLLEWAEVHGRLYGTGRSETERALAAGRDLVLDIDVQGAAQVRQSGHAATFVFVLPPSYGALVARLSARHTETPITLAVRLENAAHEVRECRHFDHVIVNDDLETAAEELLAVVRAGRSRRERREGLVREILGTFPRPETGDDRP